MMGAARRHSWNTVPRIRLFVSSPLTIMSSDGWEFLSTVVNLLRVILGTLFNVIGSLIYVSTQIFIGAVGYMFRPVNRSSGFQQNKSRVLLKDLDPNVFHSCEQI